MKDELIIKNVNQFNEEIIEMLTSHFNNYLFIKQEFSKNNTSDELKKSFCYFYKLDGPGGLNYPQKMMFFSLLSKNEADLENILVALYEVLGNKNSHSLYLSFASKLIHTLNNELPIYDKNISNILDLPKQINSTSLEKKIENRMHIYAELKRRFRLLLINREIEAILKKNRNYFDSKSNFNWKNNLVSDTKLLDSILWALYQVITRDK